ncbi:orotate reductase [Saccharata proteae CBS 121410]|uniref:Dihydroorotate dehydrogenase (quinone), mitochondrial n=1 Tax=Saccharata proteae CBS 121410 TaxID=1314787 RepID=A0A9P4I1S6_9PEZI|nr:orotate reductase [Saccharata proteae CBS 121410]
MSGRLTVLSRHSLLRPALRVGNARSLGRQCLTPPSLRVSGQRLASTIAADTAATAGRETLSGARRLKNIFLGTSLAFVLGCGYLYATDTRASIHQYIIVPAIRAIYPDAEEAHHVGTKALQTLYSLGLHPRERADPDGSGELRVTVFGHTLDNPIGISAGLDKNAEIPDPLMALGPAVVEVGGITPLPQDGNAKPRVFRIPSQEALINRYGLNSEGADNVAARLRQRVREFAYQMGFGLGPDAEKRVLDGEAGVAPGSLRPGKILAVQIAKNKITPDGDIEAVKNDYVYCVDRLAKYADVIVVNVSSPNTPGLRTLQRVEPLTRILTGVVDAAQAADRKTKPAVMVKVSPDEDSDEQMSGICEAIWESGVDGVIVGNTTKKRPAPIPQGYPLTMEERDVLLEQGGYSGPQMFERTLGLVKRYRKMLDQGPTLRALEAERAASDEAKADVSDDSATEVKMPDASDLLPSSPDDLAEAAPTIVARRGPARASPANMHKEIWATGGVTNGQQALELLNGGASVAMIYTSMVYNGSGTVTKIKNQMREQIKKS